MAVVESPRRAASAGRSSSDRRAASDIAGDCRERGVGRRTRACPPGGCQLGKAGWTRQAGQGRRGGNAVEKDGIGRGSTPCGSAWVGSAGRWPPGQGGRPSHPALREARVTSSSTQAKPRGAAQASWQRASGHGCPPLPLPLPLPLPQRPPATCQLLRRLQLAGCGRRRAISARAVQPAPRAGAAGRRPSCPQPAATAGAPPLQLRHCDLASEPDQGSFVLRGPQARCRAPQARSQAPGARGINTGCLQAAAKAVEKRPRKRAGSRAPQSRTPNGVLVAKQRAFSASRASQRASAGDAPVASLQPARPLMRL
jgi:hypothetical protein